jgi:nitrogen fixation protein FixH
MQLSKDRRIPYYFVAFFVGLAIVDGIMVTLALRTHSGTVMEHPYEAGLAYNRTIAASRTQQKLGWKAQIDVKQQTPTRALIRVTLLDENGRAIDADNVSLALTRPTQKGYDFKVPLSHIGGRYSKVIDFPLSGVWDMRVHANAGADTYQQSRRIVLQ